MTLTLYNTTCYLSTYNVIHYVDKLTVGRSTSPRSPWRHSYSRSLSFHAVLAEPISRTVPKAGRTGIPMACRSGRSTRMSRRRNWLPAIQGQGAYRLLSSIMTLAARCALPDHSGIILPQSFHRWFWMAPSSWSCRRAAFPSRSLIRQASRPSHPSRFTSPARTSTSPYPCRPHARYQISGVERIPPSNFVIEMSSPYLGHQ